MFGLQRVFNAMREVAEAWTEHAAIVREGNARMRGYLSVEDNPLLALEHEEEETTGRNGKVKTKGRS